MIGWRPNKRGHALLGNACRKALLFNTIVSELFDSFVINELIWNSRSYSLLFI